MTDRAFLDLHDLDRRMERAHERVQRFRRALRSPSDKEFAASFDPFAGDRVVSTSATFREVRERPVGTADVPLRDALVRHTCEMLQERVGRDLAVADMEASFAADPRRMRARGADASSEPDLIATFQEAESALLRVGDSARRRAVLDRLAELALPVAAVRKERRERRFEAARRLGLAHPWELTGPRTSDDLVTLAKAWLDATEPIAEEVFRRARRAEPGYVSAADALGLALALEASHGWPAGLHARWLADAFGPVCPRPARRHVAPRLPAALGGSSFLRAAHAWGRSVRASSVARAMPFALATDPYETSTHTWGFAFADAVASPLFQRRVLDVSPRLAAMQIRALRTSMLLHARWLAARFLLQAREVTSPDVFEELGARVFGAPLPPSLRDAWPRPRVDEPARFIAMVGVHAFVSDLVHRFDEDWFRNPKAGQHLASLGSLPVFETTADPTHDEPSISRSAKAFEEALG